MSTNLTVPSIRHAEANDLVSRNVAALADTPKRPGRPALQVPAPGPGCHHWLPTAEPGRRTPNVSLSSPSSASRPSLGNLAHDVSISTLAVTCDGRWPAIVCLKTGPCGCGIWLPDRPGPDTGGQQR
jgi:hypothetical protein